MQATLPPPAALAPSRALHPSAHLAAAASVALSLAAATSLSERVAPASTPARATASSPRATPEVRLTLRAAAPGTSAVVRGVEHALPTTLTLRASHVREALEVRAPGAPSRVIELTLDRTMTLELTPAPAPAAAIPDDAPRMEPDAPESPLELAATEASAVAPEAPEPPGVPSRRDVRDVMRRNLALHRRVVDRCLATPHAAGGEVLVRLVVDATGRVRSDAVVAPAALRPVGHCLTAAMRGWRFAVPGATGDFRVWWPFTVRPPRAA